MITNDVGQSTLEGPFATGTDLGDLTVGPDGAIWYTDHDAGTVVRIQYGTASTGSAAAGRRGAGPRLRFDGVSGVRVSWPAGQGPDLGGRRIDRFGRRR